MRKFTRFAFLLAMLMIASSNLHAADPVFEGGSGTDSTVGGIGFTLILCVFESIKFQRVPKELKS